MSGWLLGEDFPRPLSVCFELSLSPSALPREYHMHPLKLGKLVSDSHLVSLRIRNCNYSVDSLEGLKTWEVCTFRVWLEKAA